VSGFPEGSQELPVCGNLAGVGHLAAPEVADCAIDVTWYPKLEYASQTTIK
jgi:hypothetical protein